MSVVFEYARNTVSVRLERCIGWRNCFCILAGKVGSVELEFTTTDDESDRLH